MNLRGHNFCEARGVGLYAADLPEPRTLLARLTEAISELNRTPGTITDTQQAGALQSILASRGLQIVEVCRGVEIGEGR